MNILWQVVFLLLWLFRLALLGRIVIEFGSVDDLERIVDLMNRGSS